MTTKDIAYDVTAEDFVHHLKGLADEILTMCPNRVGDPLATAAHNAALAEYVFHLTARVYELEANVRSLQARLEYRPGDR
jgi:hypothetical protein